MVRESCVSATPDFCDMLKELFYSNFMHTKEQRLYIETANAFLLTVPLKKLLDEITSF